MASFQPHVAASDDIIKPEEYRLYVTNLPVELNEKGIKEIFDIYGKVNGLFYRPNATWAFVTYKTYREAEYALRDLDNKPPLYLKVSFRKEKTSNEAKEEKLQNTKPIEIYEHLMQNSLYNNKSQLGTINRGKRINAIYKERVGSMLPVCNDIPDDLLYPVPTDPCTYNPYESIEPYSRRNALWTRGTVTVTRDGKRHVSNGRGYTSYEIPDPHPRIEEFIKHVHEKRFNGLYEYGQDALRHSIGNCTYCNRAAEMKCEKCYSFYCSRECQVIDWPQHKTECRQIPALIERTVSSSTISNEEVASVSTVLHSQNMLRRPKEAASNALRKHAEETSNRNANIKNTKSSKIENLQNDLQTNNTTKIDNDVSKLTIEDDKKKMAKIKSSDVLQIEENIAFKQKDFLCTTSFTQVKIVCVEGDGVYWIQKTKDKKTIWNMSNNLEKDIDTKLQVEPIIGNIYAYKHKGIWYRVRVISLNPINIHFVDYGTKITVTENNFYEIKSISIPPFAKKISLSESAKEQLGVLKLTDIITVKPIKFLENIIIVDTKNSTINSVKPTNSTVYLSLSSVLDQISINVKGFLDVQSEIHDNVYGVILIPEHLLELMKEVVNALPELCNGAEKLDEKEISMGQLVCAKSTNGEWHRGCIISLRPLQVALIDEVRIIVTQEIVAYPDSLLNICKFGMLCEVNTNDRLKVGDNYEFKVVHCTKKIKIQILTNNGNNIKAVLKPWEPKTESSGMKLLELKNGSEVCITAYHGPNKLYVHSLQTEDIENYHKLMQEVAKCAQSASYLEKAPAVGEMILAQFIDDNFYRAIVTKIEKDDITVSYIDYGNTETTSLKKLKALSADLRQHPSCTAKVILKDVPSDATITKEVSEYLTRLTGKEIPMICHFDGLPSKDGVSLTLANGESINAKIKQLLTPSWEKDGENDETVYTVADIPPAKLGDGDEIRVIVLCTVTKGVKYVMCPLDIDLITNVYDVLPGLMNEYCAKADYYIPRYNELCLGLYEGNWYRGLCINSAASTDSCQIFFLDYGNLENVLHTNIRAMTKDFLTPASLSNICTVINLAPKDEDGNFTPAVLKRISELIFQNDHVLIKIIENPEQGFYTIELPEIHAKLVEEGLI